MCVRVRLFLRDNSAINRHAIFKCQKLTKKPVRGRECSLFRTETREKRKRKNNTYHSCHVYPPQVCRLSTDLTSISSQLIETPGTEGISILIEWQRKRDAWERSQPQIHLLRVIF